jgi:hypothetical protein
MITDCICLLLAYVGHGIITYMHVGMKHTYGTTHRKCQVLQQLPNGPDNTNLADHLTSFRAKHRTGAKIQ